MKQMHESIPIEITLIHILKSLKKIRPSAIVIDKHKTSLNAIQNIMYNDVYCWTYEKVQKYKLVEICFCIIFMS